MEYVIISKSFFCPNSSENNFDYPLKKLTETLFKKIYK